MTLAFPILLFGIALAVISFGFHRSFAERRFELQSKETLLTIQQGLQNYHVAEECYPRESPLSGSELVLLLTESGHLEDLPLNPWTRQPFWPEDAEQPDGITYQTDQLAETYALECSSLDLDGDTIIWQLDSSEHHSLE
mgnify:FL=1